MISQTEKQPVVNITTSNNYSNDEFYGQGQREPADYMQSFERSRRDQKG